VRNLVEGRSTWSASQASLHLLETRLRAVLEMVSRSYVFLVGLAQAQYYTKRHLAPGFKSSLSSSSGLRWCQE